MAPPQTSLAEREGNHAKHGGGIPQRNKAKSETPQNCGVAAHGNPLLKKLKLAKKSQIASCFFG